MSRLTRGLCLTLAVLFAAATVRADKPVTLRYHFKKGDRLIYRTTNTIKQSQTFGEKTFKQTISHRDVAVWTVTGKDKLGNYVFSVENKWLKVDFNLGPGGTYHYDSKSSEREKGSVLAEALTPVYELIDGATVTVHISAQGKVTKVTGYTDLLKDVLKNNPLATQIANGASDNGARISFGNLFPQFPRKALQPGNSWSVPYKLKIPKLGTIAGKRNYQYAGWVTAGKRRAIRLDETDELSLDIMSKANGADISGTISIDTSKTTIHFDPVRSRVLSVAIHLVLGGDLSIDANGQTVSLDIKQDHSAKIELLDTLPK